MSQTKTPPWERTVFEYCENTSMLERAVRIAHDKGNPKLAEFAWSELCALQAVAEAVQEYVVVTNSIASLSRVTEVWDRVKSALAALEAICPK